MLNFEKWHGNGNDFVIINSIEEKVKIKKSLLKKISDRNKGIGFDQFINICLPTKDDKDFFIKFYNSDGTEAGMCLNGIRCAASYIWKNNLSPIKNINVQTKTKNLICSPKKNNNVTVLLELPERIEHEQVENEIRSKVKDKFYMLNIGNNHVCIKMSSIEKIDLLKIYKKLEKNIKKLDINLSIFKQAKNCIEVRTYENGVGETLSCGSASLCVASIFLTEKKSIKVRSIGGQLTFKNIKNNVLMSGPANFIYKGNINE